MIQKISGDLVWLYDTDVRCYDRPFQKAAIAAVAVLTPVPLMCVFVLRRWQTARALSAWQEEVRRVLSEGCKAERGWWLGVSLMRRLSLVIVYTTISDQTWKAMASCVLCVGELRRFF